MLTLNYHDTASVETPGDKPDIHLGFASIPISVEDQIQRTLHQKVSSWFDVEAQWTDEIDADVSIALTSYKLEKLSKDKNGDLTIKKKIKQRQIVLVVRNDKNISDEQADDLFQKIKKTIDEDPVLDAEPWDQAHLLKRRQMVWTHTVAAGGRKLIRPIVENAVRTWGL